jgi:hypothetical protein
MSHRLPSPLPLPAVPGDQVRCICGTRVPRAQSRDDGFGRVCEACFDSFPAYPGYPSSEAVSLEGIEPPF